MLWTYLICCARMRAAGRQSHLVDELVAQLGAGLGERHGLDAAAALLDAAQLLEHRWMILDCVYNPSEAFSKWKRNNHLNAELAQLGGGLGGGHGLAAANELVATYICVHDVYYCAYTPH